MTFLGENRSTDLVPPRGNDYRHLESAFLLRRISPAATGSMCVDRPRLYAVAPAMRCETMKVRNSLRSLKNRERSCRVIRRKGRVYVINKRQPRFKARQG